MQNRLIEDFLRVLQTIDHKEQDIYATHLLTLKVKVDDKLLQKSDLTILIGANAINTMLTNHLNHALFMRSIFELKSAKTLVETIIWVYKTYMARGFTHRYFFYELLAWIESIEELNLAIPHIKTLYQLMVDKHELFISLAHIDDSIHVDSQFETNYKAFVQAILLPDINQAMDISNEFIQNNEDIALFWQGVILPSLYEVGRQWANNMITVGREHLATSIVQKVMALHYPKILNRIEFDAKRIVVACSPNELHEVGARMVSDLLELQGFNVLFLGANTPNSGIIDIIKLKSPIAIAISTTLVGNVVAVKELIEEINKEPGIENLKTIVGGQAYLADEALWKETKADFYANNISDMIEYIESFNGSD